MNTGILKKVYIAFGRIANKIPYSFVPKVGSIYCSAQKDIEIFEKSKNKEELIFKKVHAIVEYAIKNIKFYQDFYKEKGFDIEDLKSFDDIVKIPVVTKENLMNCPIDDRSCAIKFKYLANTGGSTGKPLSFYKTRDLQVKEMAYYHYAWQKLGYRKSDLRLQFVGRLATHGEIIYDITKNELKVDVYTPFESILKQIADVKGVKYLQGYPSVIYEFALFCEQNRILFEKSGLNVSLKGIFLNSEYPYPLYRMKIEQVFGVNTIAGYGHTEGGALAFDIGNHLYEVFQSYGYVEPLKMEDGIHLLCTTYDNFASPLIRYDTNDLMDEVEMKGGILRSFKMTNGGRNGQYIEDKNGKKISLTGLIFGKHHQLFKYCSQLQISQSEKGKATIYYVPIIEIPSNVTPIELFDSSNTDVDFSFKKVPEPIKTKAGKVLLLVKEIM